MTFSNNIYDRRALGHVSWGLENDSPSLRWDIGFTRKTFRQVAIIFGIGGCERDFHLNIGMYWVCLYLSLSVFPNSLREFSHNYFEKKAEEISVLNKKIYGSDLDPLCGRETGIRIFDGSIWLHFWNNDSCWSSEDTPGFRGGRWHWGRLPWLCFGWNKTINVLDILMGCEIYEEDLTLKLIKQVTFEMPEGDYFGRILIRKVRSGRRWFKEPWQFDICTEVINGIPFPDKNGITESIYIKRNTELASDSNDLNKLELWVNSIYFVRELESEVKKLRNDFDPKWQPSCGWPQHCKLRC